MSMATDIFQDNMTMPPISTLERAIESNDLKLLQSVILKCTDINEQNVNGNTALHLAISKCADFDILKILLTNGSSVTIKNNEGYNPLQLIDPESGDTFLNLLRLEDYIDYRGGFGNTIMHLMVTTGTTETQTWNTILEELPHLKIDFNAQNAIGQTPLHIAASRETGTEDLQFILSHFEHLNILLADRNGDTFLHTYLADDKPDSSFLNSLLEGRYKGCPKSVLKQILRRKNLTGHTPLHLCIHETDFINLNVLTMFLNAGAEINSNNLYGESVLHALLWNFAEEAEVIEYAVTSGCNVNARNGFGETPIFFADNKDVCQILINAGADVHVKNKVGKTPMMAHMLKTSIERDVVEMLLAKGADVNAVDVYGNTVLHLAAWNDAGTEIVNLLKQYGVKVVPDYTGQLPCYIAQYRGHVTLIDDLCICENGVNAHSPETVFQKQYIQGLFEQNVALSNDTFMQEKAKYFQASCISDILKNPEIGPISLVEESGIVKDAVVKTVQKICEEIARNDKILANTVIQTRSVGENTKVGLPDEFDFVCLFDLFSSICEVDEVASIDDPGYAYLKLKTEFRKADQYRHLFNADFYLDGEGLRKQFITALKNVIQNPSLTSHANIIMEYGEFTESQLAPNCKLSLRWTSCKYKDIQINIDLVPACRINGWWPPHARVDNLSYNAEAIRKEGALLLCQTGFDEDYEVVLKLRISALTAEKMQMANLPQIAREAYMISKILCGERVCPWVKLSENSPNFLKTNITSYMLKNCLFHVLEHEASIKALQRKKAKADKISSERLHDYVCKIFRNLKQCIHDAKLPSYIFPWQDIFSFQSFETDLFGTDQNLKNCACRLVYTKLILTILGKEENFTDIDVKVFDSP